MAFLSTFRAAVVDVVTAHVPALPLHASLPDDVAEVPCAVVGLPSWQPGDPSVTEIELDLWLVGRRQGAGDPEPELIGWAEQLIDAFGGTRNVASAGVLVHMVDGASRIIDIAGHRTLAYQMTITASAVEC